MQNEQFPNKNKIGWGAEFFIRLVLLSPIASLFAACSSGLDEMPQNSSFSISFSSEISEGTLDGRLILILSRDHDEEPRFQVRPGVDAPQIFGLTVEGMNPDATINL